METSPLPHTNMMPALIPHQKKKQARRDFSGASSSCSSAEKWSPRHHLGFGCTPVKLHALCLLPETDPQQAMASYLRGKLYFCFSDPIHGPGLKSAKDNPEIVVAEIEKEFCGAHYWSFHEPPPKKNVICGPPHGSGGKKGPGWIQSYSASVLSRVVLS